MDKNISDGDVYSNDPRFTTDEWTSHLDEALVKLERSAMAMGGLSYMAETLACDACKALHSAGCNGCLDEVMACCSRCAFILAMYNVLRGGINLKQQPPDDRDTARSYTMAEAIGRGQGYIWTNDPMDCGHIGWRDVDNGRCWDCWSAFQREMDAEWAKRSAEVKAKWQAEAIEYGRKLAEEKRAKEWKARERINRENAERSKTRDTVRKRSEREAERAEKIANGEAPKRRGRPRKEQTEVSNGN